jgi:DNA (cytosine-5)-methyltransferase 1
VKPHLLDLYCGAGGAARGYQLAGFRVTGVDVNPQPDYCGDEFIQADARDVLNDAGFMGRFVACHASPPCQAHSALTKGNRRRGWKDEHVDLIPTTRDALAATGRPWVIENVQGAPIRRDLTLCGLSFGLKVFRHRYFEVSRFAPPRLPHPSHAGHRVAGWRHGVRHDGDMVAVYGDGGGKGSLTDWQIAMGIDWIGDKATLAEAIPPAYTRYIGDHLMKALEER